MGLHPALPFPNCRLAVHIRSGKILEVTPGGVVDASLVMDFKDAVISPGVIDVHVHLNEPGRTEWEGATRLLEQVHLWGRALPQKSANSYTPCPDSHPDTRLPRKACGKQGWNLQRKTF